MESIETIERRSFWGKGKLFLKGIIVFGMAFTLWLPTNIVMNIVKEREDRQKEAIADISTKWAGKQTVTGPFLLIPYYDHQKDDKGNSIVIKKKAYFLPDMIEAKSIVYPEKRHRGIYEVAVYRSDIIITAKFKALLWQQLQIPGQDILWDEGVLVLSIKDILKGINEDIFANWDDSLKLFNPQESGSSDLPGAFVASVPINIDEAAKEHNCKIKISLNGSEQLLFAAVARDNRLELKSTWPNPSFTGAKLPDSREVNESGFVANWKFLNRTMPQVWKNTFYDLSAAVIGADLFIPVDNYDKTERSIKYALLCIILTFASFFLIESIYRKPLHLIHYGLAGLALVLFYTLLLSISEYTGYNMAYLISGCCTIGLIAWFVGGIMHSLRLALFISFVLAVVYSYIFTIIQLQDYALLMGSIGLFISLGIIMYFSRKILT